MMLKIVIMENENTTIGSNPAKSEKSSRDHIESLAEVIACIESVWTSLTIITVRVSEYNCLSTCVETV